MDPITASSLLESSLEVLEFAGYPIVLVITVLKNIFVVGPVTPGEGVVVAAAFLSSPHYGILWWPAVWLAAVTGTVLGSNISFYLGRKHGRDALLRYGERFRICEERIARAERYFETHGAKTVFVGRFAFGFKNYVPLIAGVSRMAPLSFQLYTVLGAIAYTSFIMAVGYLIGGNLELALAFIVQVGYAGAAVMVALLAGIVVIRRRSGAFAEPACASADAGKS